MIMLVIRQSLSVIIEVLIKQDKKTCPIMCFNSHNKWPLTVKRTLEEKTFVWSPMKQLFSGSLVWNDVIQLLCPLLQQVNPTAAGTVPRGLTYILVLGHSWWTSRSMMCLIRRRVGDLATQRNSSTWCRQSTDPRYVLKDSTRVPSHEG